MKKIDKMTFHFPKLILILFLLNSNSIFGQIDSLKQSETKIIKLKPNFVINADIRQSFVKNSPITIYGGYAGLRFKDKNLISLGYYTLSDSSKQQFRTQNKKQAASTTPLQEVGSEVSLWFLSLGYTRTVYDGKIFKIDIPVEVGFGEGTNGIYDTDGKLLRLTTDKVFPLQAGVSTTIKLTRWFGVHLQTGYREILGKSIFQNQYSGLYYTYGISLNFGTIYRDFVKKNVE
jgi:hypothetical protein